MELKRVIRNKFIKEGNDHEEINENSHCCLIVNLHYNPILFDYEVQQRGYIHTMEVG